MNGKRFVLDTNAIVSLLKKEESITELLKGADWIGISIISVIEFLSFDDLTESDAVLFKLFVERIAVIDIRAEDFRLIDTVCLLRKKHHLKTPDAIVVASSIVSNALLLTKDKQIIKNVKEAVRIF